MVRCGKVGMAVRQWCGRGVLLILLAAALAALPLAGQERRAAEAMGGVDRPCVALTFDDGPRASTTSLLLDGLSQRGVHATFFVIGDSVDGCEELLQRMAGEGHQIGIHSQSHQVLTGLSSAVILAFVLFEGVAEAIDCKPGESYYATMIVATFLASALGTTVIPYRSYLTAMVGSFSKILGTTMNGAMYIIYAFCFMLIFMLLMLLVMKFILRVDMSKLEKLDTQALAKDVGKINLTGKLLLVILGIVILGIIYPLVIKSGVIYNLLSNVLTNNLFFGLAAVAACMIHVQGKPLMDINKAISKYVPWGLLFSMGIMLFFADCLSSADSGVREFLSITMGNLFGGMASWLFIVCVVVLTVVVTGFFSNMATGIVILTATAPLAPQFGVDPMFLGILVMFSSMFGFLTPGGNGMTPLLYGREDVTSGGIYKCLIPFMLVFMIMNVLGGVVLGAIF